MDIRLHKGHRKKLAKFIKRWTIPWYIMTTLLYFLAIPFTVLVFPATTLILTVIVLFGGFTSSMAALASVLVTDEQDDRLQEATNGSVQENGSVV